ncbi:MAG: flagellar basal body P-ring protein FlgI [Planctomycetota bacterium]|nr:MAG: flagellar basal body P-ring protein FlgI [Planctomycetota bacterium]
MTPRRFIPSIPLALLVAVALAGAARATSVQELVRLKGQGESVLQGLGLVIGLPGTGDAGEDLIVARPLAKLLENSGNPIGGFDELASSRSVALVMVTARIDKAGARPDDAFDVTVTALNNPASLAGGELFLAPLRAPLPPNEVYAIAQGPVVIEGDNPARGVVRGGARVTREIRTPTVAPDGTVTLLINPNVAGWTTATLLTSVINQHRLGLDLEGEPIALAIDERTVRVRIPTTDLRDPAGFIADILSVRFDPSLLDLPARVVVNEREGIIVMTGDVEISPTALTHGDLVITSVTPPAGADPAAPAPAGPSRWAGLSTSARPQESARLADLLAAFKQLDVPVDDQIAILMQLHRTGALHAELIVN